MQNNRCAIILAGGNSDRMGYPKPFLVYNGKNFLRTIVEIYSSAGLKKIFVVLNKKFCAPHWEMHLKPIRLLTTIIENPYPELGRAYSLKLALEKINGLDFCYIQNVDQPFVTKKIIDHLWQNQFASGYTSPTFKGKAGHPILISKLIIEKLRSAISYDFNVRHILYQFPVRMIEVEDEKILWNINTKQDYEKYIQHQAEQLV